MVSKVTSQKEGSGFEPAGQLGFFYVGFVRSPHACMDSLLQPERQLATPNCLSPCNRLHQSVPCLSPEAGLDWLQLSFAPDGQSMDETNLLAWFGKVEGNQ